MNSITTNFNLWNQNEAFVSSFDIIVNAIINLVKQFEEEIICFCGDNMSKVFGGS